jgi:hypothetical protein
MICGKFTIILTHPMEIVDTNPPQTFYSFISGRIFSKGFTNHIKNGRKIN